MCGNEPGSKETYAEQVCLPLGGKVTAIDRCIHHVVAALNAGGVRTVSCCCGHGKMPGQITLEDGRELVILTEKQAREVVRHYMDPEHARAIGMPPVYPGPIAGGLPANFDATTKGQS